MSVKNLGLWTRVQQTPHRIVHLVPAMSVCRVWGVDVEANKKKNRRSLSSNDLCRAVLTDIALGCRNQPYKEAASAIIRSISSASIDRRVILFAQFLRSRSYSLSCNLIEASLYVTLLLVTPIFSKTTKLIGRARILARDTSRCT